MSVTFTQTDTAIRSFASQCATAPDGLAKANPLQNEASIGGTAGSTQVSTTVNKADTQDAVFFGTPNVGETTGGIWAGGAGNEISFDLNCTSANGSMSVVQVTACRMNGTATQATYGTWTGTTSLGTTGVKNFSLTTTQQTASTTDWILFIVQFSVSGHADQSAGITPSEDIVAAGITLVTLPVWDQDSFQAYYDDGTEATATTITTANTNWSQYTARPFHLRFLLQDTASTDSGDTVTVKAQYNLNTGGWTDITTSTPVALWAASGLTDGGATTQRLGAGTFVAGEQIEGPTTTGTSGTITALAETEFVLGLILDEDSIAATDSIQIRLIESNDTVFNSYTNTPTITALENNTPSFTQSAFRGRNDDGTETSATWIAALNTNWQQDVKDQFRLRIAVEETNGIYTQKTVDFKLQYNNVTADGAGVWNDVGAVGTIVEDVRAFASGNVADNNPTTQQITAGDFIAGKQDDSDASVTVGPFGGTGGVTRTELEYTLDVYDTNITPLDDINFRVLADNSPLTTYTFTPQVEVVDNISPNWRMDDARGYYDDGSESTATVLPNGDATFDQVSNPYRVRFVVQETAGAFPTVNMGFKLYYGVEPTQTTFYEVGAVGTTYENIRFTTSSYVSDGDTTTSRIHSEYTHFAGRICNTNNAVQVGPFSNNQTEIEFIVEFDHSAGTRHGPLWSYQNVEFRLFLEDDSAFDSTGVLTIHYNTSAPAIPNWRQDNYRTIHDDGTEVTATYSNPLNGYNDYWIPMNSVHRVRTVIFTQGSSTTRNLKWQYEINFDNNWTDLGAPGLRNRSVHYANSSYLTDQQATTERGLDDQAHTFTSGYVYESNHGAAVTLDTNEYTELELVFTLNSDFLVYDNNVNLRLVETDGTLLDGGYAFECRIDTDDALVNFTLDDWRFRLDNGSETTATWPVAANTDYSGHDRTNNLRLRYAISGDNEPSNDPTLTFQLQYAEVNDIDYGVKNVTVPAPTKNANDNVWGTPAIAQNNTKIVAGCGDGTTSGTRATSRSYVTTWVYSGGVWVENTNYLENPLISTSVGFGSWCAMTEDGQRLFVMDNWSSTDRAGLYFYTWQSGTSSWQYEQRINTYNWSSTGIREALHVSQDGEVLVCTRYNGTNYAYTYYWNGTNYSYGSTLSLSTFEINGICLSGDGNKLLVPHYNNYTAQKYNEYKVYKRINGSTWSLESTAYNEQWSATDNFAPAGHWSKTGYDTSTTFMWGAVLNYSGDEIILISLTSNVERYWPVVNWISAGVNSDGSTNAHMVYDQDRGTWTTDLSMPKWRGRAFARQDTTGHYMPTSKDWDTWVVKVGNTLYVRTLTGAEVWANVGATGAVHYVDSSNVTNGEVTTQQLSSGPFDSGEVSEDGIASAQYTQALGNLEVEYVVGFDTSLARGHTYKFRVNETGQGLGLLTQTYPQLDATHTALIRPLCNEDNDGGPRFKYDNGTEALAQWDGTHREPPVIPQDNNFRLRFPIKQDETSPPGTSNTFKLQYGGQPTWHKTLREEDVVGLGGYNWMMSGDGLMLMARQTNYIWRTYTRPNLDSGTWTAVHTNLNTLYAGYTNTDQALSYDGSVLVVKDNNLQLRTYNWNGSTWTEISSARLSQRWSASSLYSNFCYKVALSGDGLVLITTERETATSNTSFNTYDWNGGTSSWDVRTNEWTQTGTPNSDTYLSRPQFETKDGSVVWFPTEVGDHYKRMTWNSGTNVWEELNTAQRLLTPSWHKGRWGKWGTSSYIDDGDFVIGHPDENDANYSSWFLYIWDGTNWHSSRTSVVESIDIGYWRHNNMYMQGCVLPGGKQVVQTAGTNNTVHTERLYYFERAGYEWTDVGAAGTNTEKVQFANSPFITNGEVTTQQMTTGNFTAGKVAEAQANSTVTFTSQSKSEMEYVLELVSANVTEGEKIDFRMVHSNGNEFYVTDTWPYNFVQAPIRLEVGPLTSDGKIIMESEATVAPMDYTVTTDKNEIAMTSTASMTMDSSVEHPGILDISVVATASMDPPADVYASLTQANFRGRNNDGNETTATWIDAAGANWSQEADHTFRIRYLIENTVASNKAEHIDYRLQYRRNEEYGNFASTHAVLYDPTPITSGYFGSGVAVSADGSKMAVGHPADGAGGEVHYYTSNGSTWTYQETFTASDAGVGDEFGYSVSMSAAGDKVIIGAPGWDGAAGANQGAVYVFTDNGGFFEEMTALIPGGDPQAGARFGEAVAMSGDDYQWLVGAPNWDDGGDADVGKVYWFEWTDGTPGYATQQGTTLQGTVVGGEVGKSLALDQSGELWVVGMPGNNAYFFYDRSGVTVTPWSPNGWEGAPTGIGFGTSVDITNDGTTIVVGLPLDDRAVDNVGHVAAYWLYDSIDTISLRESFYPSGLVAESRFGFDVAVEDSGHAVVIGAPRMENGTPDQGALYRFAETTEVWNTVGGPGSAWPLRSITTQAVTDGEATTQQLGSGTFHAGEITEDGLTATHNYITGACEVEHEWVLSFYEKYADVGSFYDVRVVEGDGTALASYTDTPRITLLTNPDTLPELTASIYRARNDDNYENLATWKVPANTNWDQSIDENFRLRFAINNTVTPSPTLLKEYKLQYNYNLQGVFKVLDFVWKFPQVADDQYGSAIAVSGDGAVAAVTAPGSNKVVILEYDDTERGSWVERENIAVSLPEDFPHGVALNYDGTVLAVGESSANSFTGEVSIWDYTTVWTKRGSSITANDADTGDLFGSDVALDHTGTKLIVGAAGWDNGATLVTGKVYTYSYDGTWNIGEVVINTVQDDQMGISVAMSGDGNHIAFGASQAGQTGSPSEDGWVKFADWDGNNWQIRATALSGTNGGRFGRGLDMDRYGRVVVIGEWAINLGYSDADGRVHFVDWDGDETVTGQYTVRQTMNDPSGGFWPLPSFGYGVGMSSNGLSTIIGMPGAYGYSGQYGLIWPLWVDHTWIDVPNAGTGGHPVEFANSTWIVNGESTTQQLSGGSFDGGEVREDDTNASNTVTQIGASEFEFVLEVIGTETIQTDTIRFRLVDINDDSVPVLARLATPVLTVFDGAIRYGVLDVTSTATFTADYTIEYGGALDITSTATFAAISSIQQNGALDVTATATATMAGTYVHTGALDVTSTATMTAIGEAGAILEGILDVSSNVTATMFARLDYEGLLDVTAQATFSAQAINNVFGAGDWTAIASMALSGDVTRNAALDISSTATFTADAVNERYLQLDVASTTTFTAVAYRLLGAKLDITSVATFTADAVNTVPGSIYITSKATMTAIGDITRLAVLDATSTATMTVAGNIFNEASLDVSSTFTASIASEVIKPGALDISSIASVTLLSEVAGTLEGILDVTATATMTPTGVVTYAGVLDVSSDATATLVGALIIPLAADWTSTATWAAVGNIFNEANVDWTAIASWTAVGYYIRHGILDATATATMTPLGGIAHQGVLDLTTTATMAADANMTRPGAVDLNSVATMSLSSEVIHTGVLDLTSTATFTATATDSLIGEVTMDAVASMTSVGDLTHGASMTMLPVATFTAVANSGAEVTGILDVTSTATMATVGDVTRNAVLDANSTATATIVGRLELVGLADWSSVATMAAIGTYLQTAALDVSSVATFTAQADVGQEHLGELTANSISSVLVSANIFNEAIVAMNSLATVVFRPERIQPGALDISALAALTIVGDVDRNAVLDANSIATMTAYGYISSSNSILMASNAQLSALGVLTLGAKYDIIGVFNINLYGRLTTPASVDMSVEATFAADAINEVGAQLSANSVATTTMTGRLDSGAAVQMDVISNIDAIPTVAKDANISMSSIATATISSQTTSGGNFLSMYVTADMSATYTFTRCSRVFTIVPRQLNHTVIPRQLNASLIARQTNSTVVPRQLNATVITSDCVDYT